MLHKKKKKIRNFRRFINNKIWRVTKKHPQGFDMQFSSSSLEDTALIKKSWHKSVNNRRKMIYRNVMGFFHSLRFLYVQVC